MDIEPKSSISALLAEAMNRVDGRAMYFALVIFLIGSTFFGSRNLIAGDFSFAAWKVVLTSVLMIPLTVLIYFGLASFSTSGSAVSRWINAVCLVGIPMYLYSKLL